MNTTLIRFSKKVRIKINECLYIIKRFDGIDVSEGIDINKTSPSKECDICHYLYFLNYCFKFQINVWNRCHDLLMMSMNLSDIVSKYWRFWLSLYY